MQDGEAVPAVLHRADRLRELRRQREDREAVRARESALPDDDERALRRLCSFSAKPCWPDSEFGEGLGAGAEIIVGIGQVDVLADHADRAVAPTRQRLRMRTLSTGGLDARVRADDQDRVRLLDAGDRRVEQVGAAAMRRVQLGAVLPGSRCWRRRAPHQQLQREHFLDRREIARNRADPVRLRALHALAAMAANASRQVAGRSRPSTRTKGRSRRCGAGRPRRGGSCR